MKRTRDDPSQEDRPAKAAKRNAGGRPCGDGGRNAMPRSVLITGGAGFIGSNVACYLVKHYPNTHWVVYDKLAYCGNVRNLQEVWEAPNFAFVRGDICDQAHVLSVLRVHKIDAVMHFAAESHVDNSFLSPERFTLVNTTGTQRLLEAVRQAEGQILRFVHVSTDEVYGCCNDGTPRDEGSQLRPTNPYAASKAAAEMVAMSYYYSFKIPIVMTRGNNVYGSKQLPEKLVPKFITQLREGRKLTVHGTGQSKRSWLHVDDVVRAFETVLLCGEVGETYNIGSLNEYTVMEITRQLLELRGIKGQEQQDRDHIKFVPDRVFNDGSYVVDSSKMKALGWEEKVSFAEGLQRTVAWYDANPKHWDARLLSKVIEAHPTTGNLADLQVDMASEQCSAMAGPDTAEKPGGGKISPTYLLYGARGWIGAQFDDMARERGIKVIRGTARLENREAMRSEIALNQPARVVNCAGVTGRPNVCWCEDNKESTVRANVVGTLNLVDVCHQMGVHCTNLATGCIFTYDEEHPEPKLVGGVWEDVPMRADNADATFTGSWYSRTKGYVDSILQRSYPNTLTLRMRMPIGNDMNPRSFVTKITKYEKVVNIPNSMSVLHDLLPLMLAMVDNSVTGVYNFANPGVISHNQVLDIYTKHVDPSFRYKNFTIEEHDSILKSKRSNNWLDTAKLEKLAAKLGIALPSIIESVDGVFRRFGEQSRSAQETA